MDPPVHYKGDSRSGKDYPHPGAYDRNDQQAHPDLPLSCPGTRRDPTPEEIADRMEYPVDKVKKVLKIAKEPISLETPIGDEEDSSLGDFIEDKKAVAPAEEVVNTKLSEQIASVLADLTPREEQVLRKRFGIGEKSDHTLEEVGKLFNVTRERIRQIEAKALRKLRHPVRSQVLRSFYDS